MKMITQQCMDMLIMAILMEINMSYNPEPTKSLTTTIIEKIDALDKQLFELKQEVENLSLQLRSLDDENT